jgi:hypothetical protein
MIITKEQAVKIATMLLQAAKYSADEFRDWTWGITLPCIADKSEDKEGNFKAIAEELTAILNENGIESSGQHLFDHWMKYAGSATYFEGQKESVKAVRTKFPQAIYNGTKGRLFAMSDSVWSRKLKQGSAWVEKLNIDVQEAANFKFKEYRKI